MDILGVLLMPLLITFGLCAAVLTVSALRNRVMFKMAFRNIPRRKVNTALTCLGLMLAAMIFSASFATGDTLSYSIRSLAVKSLGEVDIMVMSEGVDFGSMQMGMETTGRPSYFQESESDTVRNSLSGAIQDGVVDGVAPAIIETVPVAAESRLNEPAVTLLGLDHRYMDPFDPLLDSQGNRLSLKDLEDLGDGHAYVNAALAEALEAGVGDQIEVYLGTAGTPLTIDGIYESGGNPSTFSLDTAASMVVPLSQVQSIRGSSEINFIIITNRGDAIDGAEHTQEVTAILGPVLEGTGLKAQSVKQDALDEADEGGAMFSSIFLMFGSFSIIAGVMLIFLILVMLAAERKRELGIARAVGAQREHIIRLFTYEGALYALMASAIGAGLGLLVSWAMIQVMAGAFEEMGFGLVYHFTVAGLIMSYTMGVVITLLVVVISAWRVSRLNIISAIKDIPEPRQTDEQGLWSLIRSACGFRLLLGFLPVFWVRPGPAFRLWVATLPFSLPVLGLLVLFFGLQEKQWAQYSLGSSLLIIGVCLLARRFRLPDRAAYTLAGLGLLAFWLTPGDYHPYGDEMSGGMESFILAGVMMVGGGVFVVMYNSDLLLSAIMSLFGRIRTLAPVLKTAVSYPMASRFRTGMALAMFSLIIFTLVVMSVMNASFDSVLSDTDRVSGGFDIRGEVSLNNPIPDIQTALDGPDGVGQDSFQSIGSLSYFPAKVREADKGREWDDLYLTGVDQGYTTSVTYSFELMTKDYDSEQEVWRALTDSSALAVLNAAVVPTRGGQMGDNGIDLVVGEGEFYLEDDILPDNVYIEVRNAFTGQMQKLHVIGVVDVMAGPYAAPITTSQETVNALAGFPVSPTSYRFQVRSEGAGEVPELARALEKQFMENGMNTEVMAEEVRDFGRMNAMFMNLIMAFMGLGLIVGIAALGVIAARSVVERRQQIGMLRAIGFEQRMVQISFLLESSFIALLGIGLGVALGVAISYQIDTGIEGMTTVIPWARIGLIVGLAYLASLFTTFLPAYQAARVYPAEALRFE